MTPDLEKQLKALRDNAFEELSVKAMEIWSRDLYFPDTNEILKEAKEHPDEYPNISAFYAARKLLAGDEGESDKELLHHDQEN